MPLVFVFIFGYAIRSTVEEVPVVILNRDGGGVSRELVDAINNSRVFNVKYYAKSDKEIRTRLDAGEAKMGVIIPSDFGAKVSVNDRAGVIFLIDGTDMTTANNCLATCAAIVSGFSGQLVVKEYHRESASPLNVHVRVWYNPELKDVDFVMPGLVGAVLLQVGLILTSVSIVRERERNTFERLAASPLSGGELILGKLISYALIAAWDFVLILCIAVLWFKMPLNGSVFLLLGVGCVYLIACLSMGLLISSVAQTQWQAIQLATIYFLLALLLSGFLFPISSMPTAIQYLTHIFPLTYFIVIARAIILKGTGFEVIAGEFYSLIIFTAVVMMLSVLRMRRNMV
jgi:ABC-2 type transport system permease protein